MAEVRAAYRRLVRQHHPDVNGERGTDQTVRLTQAYALLRRVAKEHATEVIDAGVVDAGALDGGAAATGSTDPARGAPARPPRRASARAASPYEAAVQAELAAGDTVLLRAPAGEAFAALFEAAGRIGHVAYFDRQLGILETIVRFEGGPSCSLLVTLQGRAGGTEAFCTLESIEAAPTPPLAIVMDALLEALAAR